MNINTMFRTIARISTANSISRTGVSVPVTNAAATTAQRPSSAKRRRLARCLVTATAVIAVTAVGAAPANADVRDPFGFQHHTTAMCDAWSASKGAVSLQVVPETSAVLRVHMRQSTGVVKTYDLYPTSAPPMSRYDFFNGPGLYEIYVEHWYPDAAGNMYLHAGEWLQDNVDIRSGDSRPRCFLG